MTALDRHSTRHDPLPAPETDLVARRLRRRHWTVLALAVLLLAGVLGAACYLTALTPTLTETATAATDAVDPWGPQLPRPSLLVDRGWPGRRPPAITATARTAGIGAAGIAPPPQLTATQPVPAQLTAGNRSASP